MKKWLWILVIFPLVANAAYQRNQARPVNEVIFGEVDSIRYVTQHEIVQSKSQGWETLLSMLAPGVRQPAPQLSLHVTGAPLIIQKKAVWMQD